MAEPSVAGHRSHRASRSPLTSWLRAARQAGPDRAAPQVGPDRAAPQGGPETAEASAGSALSRRRFLQRAGAVAAAAALSGGLVPLRALAKSQPRIVIVGAGLAGLRCAERLWHRGLRASVFESSDRVGGRCWTNRGFFAGGAIAEHGGEFISSEHHAMRRLATELGLTLDVINGGGLTPTGGGTDEVYWMDGAPYTFADATADWFDAFPAFKAAANACGSPTWDQHTPEAVRLDRMSVPEWIDSEIAGGTRGRFGRLLLADVISEYGGEPADQSALNIIGLLSGNGRRHLDPLSGTDELYHIAGGNDQVVSGLVGRLPAGTIQLEAALTALRLRSDGSYRCTFEIERSQFDVDADLVVLALPFSTLRDCNLAGAGFTPLKLATIRTLGMGMNAKLIAQLTRRTWGPAAPEPAARGYSGIAYSEPSGFETTWDGSVGHGPSALLVDYLGARQGAHLHGSAHGPAAGVDVNRFLQRIEPLFPGTTAAWNGLAWSDFWAADRWHHGAYAFWRVGQYTTIAGYEAVPQGGVAFAGEHTSLNFQGYMEGALRSGADAATWVAKAAKQGTKAA